MRYYEVATHHDGAHALPAMQHTRAPQTQRSTTADILPAHCPNNNNRDSQHIHHYCKIS
jgi:hypothetical protein